MSTAETRRTASPSVKGKTKKQEFFALAKRFRNAADPKETRRLGNKLGRLVFAGKPKGE